MCVSEAVDFEANIEWKKNNNNKNSISTWNWARMNANDEKYKNKEQAVSSTTKIKEQTELDCYCDGNFF